MGAFVKRTPRILIADRNPHVRALLKREMTKEGWHVLLAKSSHDIVRQMFHKETVDILILDSELPGRESSSVMRMLEKQYPFLAVVKHVADAKESRWPDPGKKAYVVEKSGNSVETLKRVVKRFILKTGYKSCNGDP